MFTPFPKRGGNFVESTEGYDPSSSHGKKSLKENVGKALSISTPRNNPAYLFQHFGY